MKKKNSIHNNNEIDLSELFKTLWNKKIKITLITVISFAIIVGYDNYKPKNANSFKNSLVINLTKEKEFLGFLPIFDFLNEDKVVPTSIIEGITTAKILDSFIEEFLDYEELIIILKDSEDIKKDISQLSEYDQQRVLHGYAKLFNMNKSKTEMPNYTLNFTWQENDREIRDIIDKAIKLTLENLKASIFLEIDSYYKSKKESIINKDLTKVEYLLEQSLMAKELNIKEMSEDTRTELDKNGNVSFNFSPYVEDPYYLRGYQAINMEIDLIKNRKHLKLENIRKEIDLLKKKDIKWIDYNIFLLDAAMQNKVRPLSLSFAFLFSLIIGAVYVLISNAFQFHKSARKK